MLVCLTFNLSAQSEEEAPSTFAFSLNMDNAFGFNPAVFGSFGLNEKVSFTYYGIFWTNHDYTANGLDAWLETGVGLGFPVGSKLYLNPSIGFTHGNLLSNTPVGGAFEGIVPNLAGFYTGDIFEAEIYAGYYAALKDDPNTISSDFLLYWIYPGVRITDKFSAGLHYEQFYLAKDDTGDSGSLYQWVGAYLKFTVGDKYTFRLSAGENLNDDAGAVYSPSFYKLSVFVPLL